MKKAFTLAEILIVLTVIGVLTAILLPIAFQASPDEDVMKFKKANANLGRAIYELVNSDKYYQDGDLGIKADGTQLTASSNYYTYFCETLADILSIKSKNCSTATHTNYAYQYTTTSTTDTTDKTSTKKASFDSDCASAQSLTGAEIITSDGVYWFQGSPLRTFGAYYSESAGTRLFGGGGTPAFKDANGFDANYKTMCIDIDGISTGEAPFGYGIRADGKILPGARADEWIEKSIQRGDD